MKFLRGGRKRLFKESKPSSLVKSAVELSVLNLSYSKSSNGRWQKVELYGLGLFWSQLLSPAFLSNRITIYQLIQRTKTITSRMTFQYLNVQHLNLFLNKVLNNHSNKVSNLNIWTLYVYILTYNSD